MTKGKLLTTENISSDEIKSVLATANLVASDYHDGDLIINGSPGTIGCIIRLRKTKTVFRVTTNCGFKASVPRTQRLACANNINEHYRIVNAYVDDDRIIFCRDVTVSGGITHANLVETVKLFTTIPVAALAEFADGLLV